MAQANMALTSLRAMLALFLLAPINIVAHLHYRQMTLNETATPTVNASQTVSIVTPPPCCWIVIGEMAVGYNHWYSTTAEQIVGMCKHPPSVRP